ncbi:protein NYNRIN-like [Pimephales promelas]|nr:protein NYNRIN-like [Pimephales promelas]
MLKGKTYLLVVDYFSRYVEIELLSPTRSTDVVVYLKSIFSRHGICKVLRSDNGPQFFGSHFKAFAAEYGFVHVTSSPKFPQSNGEAERAVQTMKNLLTKASDPYLALLAYRATPLQNGYSPAELLMGRHLRTTVPALPALLTPVLPDYNALEAKEREKRRNDAKYFNKRHGARNLEPLVPGEDVWITDSRVQGTVISAHTTPRSYIVQVPQGTLRRNRHHLVSLQTNGGVVDVDKSPKEKNAPDAPELTSPEPPQRAERVQRLCGPDVGERLKSRRDLICDLLTERDTLEDRSVVEGEAEEVVQEAVLLGSKEVEAEDGVIEVQGKEHFLDKRTCVEFCIFKLKQGHANRYDLDTRKWADPVIKQSSNTTVSETQDFRGLKSRPKLK